MPDAINVRLQPLPVLKQQNLQMGNPVLVVQAPVVQPLAVQPPANPLNNNQQIVQARDAAVLEASQLFQQYANSNANNIAQLNQRYAAALQRISDNNLALARPGGGNEIDLARRFAILQRGSLNILSQNAIGVLRNLNQQNANSGMMFGLQGELEGEAATYQNFPAMVQAVGQQNVTNQLNADINNIQQNVLPQIGNQFPANNPQQFIQLRIRQGNVLGSLNGLLMLNRIINPPPIPNNQLA